MIQNYFDADCEECWVRYSDGQLFVDKKQMIEYMKEDGWLVTLDDNCWCPEHKHLVSEA